MLVSLKPTSVPETEVGGGVPEARGRRFRDCGLAPVITDFTLVLKSSDGGLGI